MKRRKEYFYILVIMLINLTGSFALWSYSIPARNQPVYTSFASATAAAQTQTRAERPSTPASTGVNPENFQSSHVEPANTGPSPQTTVSVPVLMYHKINSYYQEASLYRILPDEFDWQMQYLKEHGYHTVDLGAVLDHFQKGQSLPAKPIVITFDDGFRDNYLYAYPILQKYGFTATIFVVTNTVASPETTNMMLNWDQIREMADNGITIGCHTLDHENLVRVDLAEAKRQIADAKNVLQEQLGRKIDFFAYPFGEHNPDVENIVRGSGFRAAVTVNPEPVSTADNPFALNRMGIYSNLDRPGFIEKVGGTD